MNPKQLAGEKATDFIIDGMVVGLGTGTTAYYMINKVGQLVKDGLRIKAVCTSEATRIQALALHIPLYRFDQVEKIDLTIDGADEIDLVGNGIKGGGGALLFEKIVAANSTANIWIVDESKMVDHLGKFPLPVEIVPFGFRQIIRMLNELGLNPILRMNGREPFRTDSNNYIADLGLHCIDDPEKLDITLKQIPGVIEHGLFQGIVNKVVVGTEQDTRIIEFR